MWSEILRSIPTESQARLTSAMTLRNFEPTGVLFWEDDPGEVVYVIESGHVLVEHAAPSGTAIPLTVLGPGEIVGEDGLLEGVDRLYTVRAIGEVSAQSLSRAAYTDLVSRWPGFEYLPARVLIDRNRRLADAVLEARHRAPEERMRRQLQDLGRMFGDEIPLSQATIAGLAGTSNAAAKGVFNALEGNGSIGIQDGLVSIKARSGLA